MRSSKSRSRNKSNRQRTLGNVVNRVFDSSGPEGKVRGTPQQIIDKYLTLARDAQLSNDRVAEQAFLQHAEHYTRMLGEAQREMAERQQFQPNRSDTEDLRDAQGNGQNGHHARDGGSRDQNPREDNRREGGYREGNRDGPREGGRDGGGRDWRPRENGMRDGAERHDRQGGRSHDSRDPGAWGQQPQPEPDLPQARADDSAAQPVDLEGTVEGLPDVVSLSEDQPAGPVQTPEAKASPPRSRAPRGEKTASAPRAPRRRKAPGDPPADEAVAEDTSATGND